MLINNVLQQPELRVYHPNKTSRSSDECQRPETLHCSSNEWGETPSKVRDDSRHTVQPKLSESNTARLTSLTASIIGGQQSGDIVFVADAVLIPCDHPTQLIELPVNMDVPGHQHCVSTGEHEPARVGVRDRHCGVLDCSVVVWVAASKTTTMHVEMD